MSRRSVAPVLKQLAVPAASLTLSVDGHELPVTNLDPGKIFFDYNQNSRGKSLAVPFSPRRHAAATVSTPVSWNELEKIYPTDLTLDTVPDRLESAGDPWAGMLDARQDLAEVLGLRRAG